MFVKNLRSFSLIKNNLRNYHNTLPNKLKLNGGISISEEVKHALIDNLPVVALESTIITHGMPYPDNIKCALQVEEEIRNQVLYSFKFTSLRLIFLFFC